MTKGGLIFWCCLFAAAMFLTVRPAHASGTVSQTPAGWVTQVTGSTVYSTASSACLAAASALGRQPDLAVVGDGTNYYGGYCYIYASGSSGADYYPSPWAGTTPAACPANSTGSSTCTCNSGYVPNAGATACVVAVVCPAAGTVISSGMYDIGDNPNGISGNGAPPLNTCTSSCENAYNGASVSARALVAGVYHYFAQGSYVSTGRACSTGDNSYSTATSQIGNDTCAPGQQSITFNGVTKCWTSASSGVPATQVDPNSAAAKAAAASAVGAAIAGAGAAASAVGGSGVAGYAEGMAAGLAAGGGTSNNGSKLPPSDPLNSFCNSNPDAPLCKAQTDGNTAVASAPTQVQIYTKASRTVSNSFSDFSTSLRAVPIISAAGSFFNVSAAGSCQTWTLSGLSVLGHNFGTYTMNQFCVAPFTDYLPLIRALVLVIFSIVAFRIAML